MTNIYNKIDLKYFNSNDTPYILLQSDELTNFYTEVFNIILDVTPVEKNNILIIMSYVKRNPIKLYFSCNLEYPYLYAYIFYGTHINVFYMLWSEYGRLLCTCCVNVKQTAGNMICNERKELHISRSNLTKKVWNITDKIYNYGTLSSYITTCECECDAMVVDKCCMKEALKKDNKDDDLHNYLPNFKEISNNMYSNAYIQIRKGKDVSKDTDYNHIFLTYPDDYFFVHITKNKVQFLTRLTEYEYLLLINELREINNLFDYNVFKNFYDVVPYVY